MSSANKTDGADAESAREDDETGSDAGRRPVQLTLIVGIAILSALLGGWIMLLVVNRWHLTAPVFFLLMGWGAILLVAYFLWRSAWTAAEEHLDMSDEEFFRPVGERDELEAEKKSLIKAIKEIEFDHQMGKMSDDDAIQLTRYYRARAIDVIKALEDAGGPADAELPVAELITRDVEARLKLGGRRAKKAGKKKSKPTKPSEPTEGGEASA